MRAMTVSTFLLLATTTTMATAVMACGDDEDSDENGAGSDASTGDAAPPDDEPPNDGITPLDDDVAGDACENDGDCEGATCADEIAGTGLLPAATPGGYCTGECASDEDCGAGGACIGALSGVFNGRCFAACSEESDCRDGYLCAGGLMLGGTNVPDTCRPAPATDQLEDDVAGAACSDDDDCGGGQCATMRPSLTSQSGTQLPGGYCTGACLQDEHCGDGGVCAPSLFPGTAGSCYEACDEDAQCERDGYRCRLIGDELRGCDVAPDPLPDGTAGAACTGDGDCGGGPDTCESSLPAGGIFGQSLEAPGGYCTQACAEPSDCGEGGVCILSLLGGRCYDECAQDGDCRDGYVCQMRGGNDGATVCVPQPPPDDDTDAG